MAQLTGGRRLHLWLLWVMRSYFPDCLDKQRKAGALNLKNTEVKGKIGEILKNDSNSSALPEKIMIVWEKTWVGQV